MKKTSKENSLKNILFEIGTEELPATNLADIFETAVLEKRDNMLEAKLKQVFESHRIAFQNYRVYATSRRLVFWVEKAAASQTPKDDLIKLLSKQEAYSADGKPAEKLLMILKHRNVPIEETVVSDLNGKEFVFIKKSETVRKTATVLPELFEALTKSLAFPKTMKWDDSGFHFPRPVRNLLCLYGDSVVRVKIGNLRSADQTVIFSKSRRVKQTVKDIDSYFKILKKHGIILDHVERKKAIQETLEKLAKSYQGKLYEDPFLMSEVNFLVENPNAVAAPFDPEFLKLPLEVLAVSMARKQRLFGLLDKNGAVMPRFLAVLDGAANEKQKKLISNNCENILHAKLQDSLFFYREDLKATLEKKREELKDLIFLKGAGSMLEKSARLMTLAERMKEPLKLSKEDQEILEAACCLSKADLLTQMVGEFPELQGIMGKYYALEAGEKKEVALAVGEQYLPRTVSDKLPETFFGALLSIFDKCDLIVACFSLGMEPTSSQDPYGLRRSAAAVLKILLDKKLDFSLRELLELLATEPASYNDKGKKPADLKKLTAFFEDRFKAVLADKGLREDLIEAAVGSGFDKPYETFLRAEAISGFFSEKEFLNACKAVERTGNILKGNKDKLPDAIDPTVFTENLEREVFKKYETFQGPIREAKKSRDFRRATSLYAEAFFDILGEFFEKVFINAEDMKVRRNRLALLRAINRLYTDDIADLSKIRSL